MKLTECRRGNTKSHRAPKILSLMRTSHTAERLTLTWKNICSENKRSQIIKKTTWRKKTTSPMLTNKSTTRCSDSLIEHQRNETMWRNWCPTHRIILLFKANAWEEDPSLKFGAWMGTQVAILDRNYSSTSLRPKVIILNSDIQETKIKFRTYK